MGRTAIVHAPAVALLAAIVGALAAGFSPVGLSGFSLAAAIVATVALVALVLVRQSALAWDAFAFVLVGLLALGYGFANVGVVPGIPLPLADVVIASLGAYALVGPRTWLRLPPAFIAAALYGFIATCRLAVDFPTWGRDALRDYSLAVELLALPAGYWLVVRFGLPRLVRLLAWAFVVVIAYSWFYPVRDLIGDIGPTVGLQKPVTLLGYVNGPAIASAFFYFVLVRPFGASLWIATAALPPLALQQARGLYIAVPLSALLLLGLSRADWSRRFASALAVTIGLGAVALAFLFTFSPQGRLGPTNARFVATQLATLRGEEGPGSGSLAVRREWLSGTLARVWEHPYGWLVGLGLGPDLTAGFTAPDATRVRKPHDDYLEAYARLGILGLSALLATLAFALGPIVAGGRRLTGRDASFLWWVTATAIVFLFVAAAQPLLAFPYGTIPLFSALGAGLAIAASDRRYRP